ncbi:hypothetical protein BGX27_002573, partial [Mortierella sp. AM989]
MSGNPLMLFCLVDGEATSNAFPVGIESTKTIGDLKELIKTKKTNDFSDVDADKLTLWRVTIPDKDDDDETLIKIESDQQGLRLWHCSAREHNSRPCPATTFRSSNGVADDEPRVYRRVLSGPMGVGKSYLSYFLAVRAYAEGWPLLYLADAGELDKKMEDEAAMVVVAAFLAQNKDILTAAELESLVQGYDGTYQVPFHGISVILGKILMQWERKTLLVIAEHGKLFKKKLYVPDKFKSLNPLADFHAWPENRTGAHVIFTGGHLELLATYPDLNQPECREAVLTMTNCVPRELVQLSNFLGQLHQSTPAEAIGQYESRRMRQFLRLAEEYHRSLDMEYFRTKFSKALLDCFFGGARKIYFQWDFLDLGMVYRRENPGNYGPTFHMLCPPAQKALLELFKAMPLPEDIRKCLDVGTNLTGEQFERALFHQLLRNPKPILLTATDVNNKNQQTISLDFDEWGTIKPGDVSLGPDFKKTLSR